MIGAPARRAGWVCRCGETLPAASEARMRCAGCGELYELVDTGTISIADQPSCSHADLDL
jgi:hypothetical protein